MSKLTPKSQLTFPTPTEIRIAYPKDEQLIIGQVAEVFFSLSLIITFILLATEFVSWKLFFVSFGLTIISGIVRFKIPANGLKTIILKPDIFKYNYYVGVNNREKRIKTPLYINFQIEMKNGNIEISFLKIVIELFYTEDFPIFIESVATMFDMEFVDTCRLSGNREILMYKSKTAQNIKYPSFINTIELPNSLIIYDVNNTMYKVNFNGNTRKIKCTNYRISDVPTYINLRDVRTINVIMTAGYSVRDGKNKIEINIVLHNNNKQTIFETVLRKQSEELTTLRDTTIICQQLTKVNALNHIEIIKEVNIR